MTEQELGTIMEYQLGVKIIILNNNYLGNVKQWQKLFFNSRYSATPLINPDFITIAQAYGIKGEDVATREELNGAIDRMFADDSAYILNVNVDPEDMIFPMICPGDPIDKILLGENELLDLNILEL